MDFFSNDTIKSMEIKDELCFKDEPLQYFPEEAYSTSSENSFLPKLKWNQDAIVQVSSYFLSCH